MITLETRSSQVLNYSVWGLFFAASAMVIYRAMESAEIVKEKPISRGRGGTLIASGGGVVARPEEKKFGDEQKRDLVDEASWESFPASDPPAY